MLGRLSAADVEEAGWLDSAGVFTGACDGVECRHDDDGTVSDGTGLTVQLDAVEAQSLGPGFERVSGVLIFKLGVTGVAQVSVVIEIRV